MPRIRVRHAQRPSLQLRADACAAVELISEPGANYDPPDASHTPSLPILPDAQGQSIAEIRAIEKELEALGSQLEAFGGRRVQRASEPTPRQDTDSPTLYCSFCGKGQEEVRKLVAGPAVFICDECIQIASEIMAKD